MGGQQEKGRAPERNKKEMSPLHREGRERAQTSDADVLLSKREVHPPAFWQLEWRRGRQNQKGLEALTPKRRPRGFHLSQVTSTTAVLPLLFPQGRGAFRGSHSWTLRGRGRGPGGKEGGWIFTNFVTRRPGPARGVGRERDACRRFSREGAGPQTKKQQE